MLRTHSSNLPVEQQQRLPPEFLANEQSYLRMRDQLLESHHGQWVAINQDQVIASGGNLMQVMDVAISQASHPYVAIVGKEEEVVFRLRLDPKRNHCFTHPKGSSAALTAQ